MYERINVKKIYGIALAATALLFFACSKSGNETAPAEAELTFRHAGLSAVTKAGPGYSDYTGNFKLYLAPENTYAALTSTFSYNGGSWSGNPAVLLSPATTSIVAWVPTGLAPASPAAPTVFALTPQFYTAARDLAYFKRYSVNSANASVGLLQLDRAYSQITFKLTKTNYPGAGFFTALTLHGITGNSTIDITNGMVTPGPAANLDLTGGLSSGQIPVAGLSVLAVPAAAIAPGTLQFSCTVDGRTYNNLNITGITELAAARNYVVNLTLTGAVLNITGVEIEQWSTVENAGSVIIQ